MMHADLSLYQVFRFVKRPFGRGQTRFCCALLLLCLIAVSGCGKRPVKVDAPVSAQDQVYPRVYPNPSSDVVP